MSETPFIITIDTEGDNPWANPREITTRNAEYLPRFQSLCERFLFEDLSAWCRGTTLKEFHARFSNGERLNDPH